MYNKITLIGMLTDHPKEIYDTDANKFLCILLKVSPPPDSPPTYWGVEYDLRAPDWPRGDDTFLVISRDLLLIERCIKTLHKGDIICVEGRLVLTPFLVNRNLVPLAEILTHEILLLA
jgi:hypothetical protein